MAGLTFYEKQHLLRLIEQEGSIKHLFDEFVRNSGIHMARWKETTGNVWARNAGIEKSIEKELVALHDGMLKNIENYSIDSWNRSNRKNDDLVTAFIKDLAISDTAKRGMYARNQDALKALLGEKINSETLSARVWKVTGTAKENIEFYLQSGLSAGRPSALISQDIRQLLQNPDRRFRRIRNEAGKLVPSAPMKDYHPGTGIYRSSFMNAKRLAVTRTNRAYRTADHERWKNLGFVLGIDIRRSASNRGPCPLCDSLVGRYPKDFHFGGWHPFCICMATPVLMDEDAFIDSLVDDDFSKAEYVQDIPDGAREYIRENIKPESYIVKDNEKWFEQKEGILKVKSNSGIILFDPLGIKTFSDLTKNMIEKVAPTIRERGLKNYLSHNKHETFVYRTIKKEKANIHIIQGAEYNQSEFHIAEKLVKSGQHVLFPNQGDLGKKRKNDVFIYDIKTFFQRNVELKSLFGETADTISSQIISGSGQSNIIAYDVQSNIKRNWLIQGLRSGWTKNTKKILLNWMGQWYEIDKELLFSNNIYRILK